MSIINALALSYVEMQQVLNNGTRASVIPSELLSTNPTFKFISITDPKVPSLFNSNSPSVLQLKFHDIVPENIWNSYSNLVLPNKTHAQQIVEFIQRINSLSEPILLLVNCMAGISRSGAVVTYVGNLCGFDPKEHNPQIDPNEYLLKLLNVS